LKTADTAHTEGSSAFAKAGEQESRAAELELRHVSKSYAGQREPAIGDLSLTVPAGEVCVLVGPSGSGKTTAMRLINRMISISGGDILLGGSSVLERDARELRREIGYMIQQIGLFPHQTVAENIATVPGLLGWPKQRIAARVHELLELIGLDPQEMTGRYPAQLSGGQRQRVGVARALAADPPLMLMDEPFGAIDPINRARLQDEFLGLQQMVKKTVVFVTHDIDEAIKMGDRIAILREGGRLAQYDTPREILTHPADEFVAEFVGADRGNILGALYAQALQAKGFTVMLKDNVGSSEIIFKALTAGQIDMYPEYTGALLSAVAEQTKAPTSADAAYQQAKSFVEPKGFTLLEKTPFYDSNTLITLPAYASEHHLSSIADLKPLGKRVKMGGAPEFATRFEGLIGLKQEYGVVPTLVPISIELSYQAIEGGQVNVQSVFSTDGQLLGGKFKVLADPKHVFGFQNVAPVVKKSVVAAEGPAFAETLNKVSALLTIPAIQQMNKAVSIDKQSATSVAAQFLHANGLS